MSACQCRQVYGWIIAQGSDGFQRHVTSSLDRPFVILLEQDRPNEPDYRVLVGEDADDVGAPLDLAVEAAEAIGLFKNSVHIGFREQWFRLVLESGYRIVGHELVPIANDKSADVPLNNTIDIFSVTRHLTALVRHGFSAPVQALARYGLINPSIEVFDYGCGRGDDVRGLVANGITAFGWDPHYAPDGPKREADVVNLGFVINVIENFNERVDALRGAYAVTKQVLAVAAMLVSQAAQSGRPYRDGFLTQRNTFQKYYTQGELAAFIANALEEEPIPVSPGVFFIFRDKDSEQRFLAGRQRNITLLQRLSRPEPVRPRLPRPDRIQLKYEANQASLDALWDIWLGLGREPRAGPGNLDRTIGGVSA